ncbi:MAG: superoxide dismutase [Deltaproteobacteria bacterium]|jgi:Fe-Mn family superoxide dismutase|nr:superoxide dismutase [Deltaproteobacteria bacterium]
MSFIQSALPYQLNALVPFLSEEQLQYHYGKHHTTYFKKLNELVIDKPESQQSLEVLIKTSTGAIFNNAAQAWNHSFFWDCLSPVKQKLKSESKLLEGLKKNFGNFEGFKEKFSNTAVSLFGSGWVWLVRTGDKLEIIPASNGNNPIRDGKTPLLTLDVWEHAYYIDYRNDRAKFVSNFWDFINWDFVAEQFEK